MCSDGKTEFENFKCRANNFKFGGEKKKEDETPTDGAGDKFTGFVEKRVGEREGERKSGLRDYNDSSPLPLYAE